MTVGMEELSTIDRIMVRKRVGKRYPPLISPTSRASLVMAPDRVRLLMKIPMQPQAMPMEAAMIAPVTRLRISTLRAGRVILRSMEMTKMVMIPKRAE